MIYYRGSRNELPGRTGISHWVEHMLFKGTDTFPRRVRQGGGAAEGRLQRHDQPRLDDLLRDLSVGSHRTGAASGKRPHGQFALRRQETELERTVILSEREGSENSYFWLLNEEVTAAAFREHAYRHPIIGWRGDLHTMQRDDLFRHYRTFYTPRNAVAVAVGDFGRRRHVGADRPLLRQLAPGAGRRAASGNGNAPAGRTTHRAAGR
ncbi:MAG: insulinase family protein [Caldilineaceae bacterium]